MKSKIKRCCGHKRQKKVCKNDGFVHNTHCKHQNSKSAPYISDDSDTEEEGANDPTFVAIRAASSIDAASGTLSSPRQTVLLAENLRVYSKPTAKPKGKGNQCQGKDKKFQESLGTTAVESKNKLLKRLEIYNNLLNCHKIITGEQALIHQKLQNLDEVYVRNTSVILRLGFCQCIVHLHATPIGEKLMKLNRKMKLWEQQTEEILGLSSEPADVRTAASVFHFLNLNEISELYGCKEKLDDVVLPNMVWNIKNPFIENLEPEVIAKEWEETKDKIWRKIEKVEQRFRCMCMEFGVTRDPAEPESKE